MVEIPIDFAPRSEQVADDVLQLHQQGVRPIVAARALGIDMQQHKDALRFALTGERPVRKLAKAKRPQNRKNAGKGPANWYKDHLDEVARLRDVEEWSFARIARHFGVSVNTVQRAYDRIHPELVELALNEGTAVRRDHRYASLRPVQMAAVEALLRAGKSIAVTAQAVGCSQATIARRKKQMTNGEAGRTAHPEEVVDSLGDAASEYREMIRRANELEKSMRRAGRPAPRLRPDQIATVEKLLRAGKSLHETTRAVGCSTMTVARIKKRMRGKKAA